ncbi:hypothetical protein PG985_003319 [Apiospora marii]|uniref:uncharacterized protein n=1 Tax=Apiospora marii TaxID=335849 RepID=UPI0031303166
MDPITALKHWDLSLAVSSTKARRRREQMLRYCGQVPGWEGKIKMLARAEHHVCRFLWELHHRGKFPEDRFCWLVDQVLFRFAEARLQSPTAILILGKVLGEMPPMRVDYNVEEPSGVWEKYERILQERTGKKKPEEEKQQSPSTLAAPVASHK